MEVKLKGLRFLGKPQDNKTFRSNGTLTSSSYERTTKKSSEDFGMLWFLQAKRHRNQWKKRADDFFRTWIENCGQIPESERKAERVTHVLVKSL